MIQYLAENSPVIPLLNGLVLLCQMVTSHVVVKVVRRASVGDEALPWLPMASG